MAGIDFTGRQVASLPIVIQEMNYDETFFDNMNGTIYVWQKYWAAYISPNGNIEWIKRNGVAVNDN